MNRCDRGSSPLAAPAQRLRRHAAPHHAAGNPERSSRTRLEVAERSGS
jgi:hypothetical protein